MEKSTSNIIHSSGTEPEATSTSSFVLAPQPQPQRNPAGGCNHHLQQSSLTQTTKRPAEASASNGEEETETNPMPLLRQPTRGSQTLTLQQFRWPTQVTVSEPGWGPEKRGAPLRVTPDTKGLSELDKVLEEGKRGTFSHVKKTRKTLVNEEIDNYERAPIWHPGFRFLQFIPIQLRFLHNKKVVVMCDLEKHCYELFIENVLVHRIHFYKLHPNQRDILQFLKKDFTCFYDVEYFIFKDFKDLAVEKRKHKTTADWSVMVERSFARAASESKALTSIPKALPKAPPTAALPSPPTTNPGPTTQAVAPSTGALVGGPTALAAPSTVAPVATVQQATHAVAPASAATAVASLPATGTIGAGSICPTVAALFQNQNHLNKAQQEVTQDMKSMLQNQQTQLTHMGTQQKQHGVLLTQHTAKLNQQGTQLTTQQQQIDYLMKSTVKIDPNDPNACTKHNVPNALEQDPTDLFNAVTPAAPQRDTTSVAPASSMKKVLRFSKDTKPSASTPPETWKSKRIVKNVGHERFDRGSRMDRRDRRKS